MTLVALYQDLITAYPIVATGTSCAACRKAIVAAWVGSVAAGLSCEAWRKAIRAAWADSVGGLATAVSVAHVAAEESYVACRKAIEGAA